MQDKIAEAAVRAAEYGGAPARTFHVGPDAVVELGPVTGPTQHPFEGMTLTHWSVD